MSTFYAKSDSESRFAERDELLQQYSTFKLTDAQGAQGGPPIISDGEVVTAITEDTNIGIIGSVGSKKSRNLVMPSILSYGAAGNSDKHGNEGASMVVIDVKGELFDKVSAFLTNQCGFKCYVINFRTPWQGNHYNPLQPGLMYFKEKKYAKAKAFYLNYAQTVISSSIHSERDNYWESIAMDLFTGLALILCKETQCINQVTIYNIYSMFVQGLKKSGGERLLKKYIDALMKSEKNELTEMIYQLCAGAISAPPETFQCIYSTTNTALSKLVFDNNLTEMMSFNDFSVAEIGKEKVALFLIVPDESKEYAALVSGLIQSIYQELIRTAQEKNNFKHERKVVFICDEFANLKIPEEQVHNMFSASRSRGLSFLIAIQSMKQLKGVYGGIGDVIYDNLGVLYYLNSPDIEMNELMSQRCGSYTTEYGKERKRLLSPERLARLDKQVGECLVFAGRNYPYVTYLPDIDSYKVPLGCVEIPVHEWIEPQRFDFEKLVNRICDDEVSEMLQALSNGNKKDKEKEKKKEEDNFYKFLDEYIRKEEDSIESLIEKVFKDDSEDTEDCVND